MGCRNHHIQNIRKELFLKGERNEIRKLGWRLNEKNDNSEVTNIQCDVGCVCVFVCVCVFLY